MISEQANRVISNLKLSWSVEDQYEIAKAIAANCGYQLVQEDTEKSLEIKSVIEKANGVYGGFSSLTEEDRKLVIEGLEALLK